MKDYTLLLVFLAVVGCTMDDCGYSRPVAGKVVATGQRIHASGEGGSEHIAITLLPYVADEQIKRTALGADGLAIDCLSTRCAALREGSCVELLCLVNERCSEPNVAYCKMVKTIPCAP